MSPEIFAALFLTLAGAPQDCGARDTNCRIERLEQRIRMLEQRVSDLAAQPAAAAGTVDLGTDFTCSDRSACARQAREACEEAGFTRGVPKAPIASTSIRGFYVSLVTCSG